MLFNSRKLLAAALVAFSAFHALPAGAHEFTSGPLLIEHPYIRAMPKGAKVAGGYVKIHNAADQPDRLVAASLAAAPRAELHSMSMANGIMSMQPLPEGIEVPAHGEIILKPGSFHIMFLEPSRQLQAGEQVEGTLVFEKAGTVKVTFMVEAMKPDAGAHTGHGKADQTKPQHGAHE